MCLSHIHAFLVLTLSLALGQMSVALAADWTPLEVCALIHEKYPQLPIPECTKDNMKVLTKLVFSLAALGFDPSNPRILSDKLSNLLKKTDQDQTPTDNQDEGDVNSEIQNVKASFWKLNFPLVSSHKNIPNIRKTPQDLPFNFKDNNTNSDLTANNISRRQAEPQDPAPTGDSSPKERIREFLRRFLPNNRINKTNHSEYDYSFMYDSLTFPAAMPKLYELQMERYFNTK